MAADIYKYFVQNDLPPTMHYQCVTSISPGDRLQSRQHGQLVGLSPIFVSNLSTNTPITLLTELSNCRLGLKRTQSAHSNKISLDHASQTLYVATQVYTFQISTKLHNFCRTCLLSPSSLLARTPFIVRFSCSTSSGGSSMASLGRPVCLSNPSIDSPPQLSLRARLQSCIVT